MPINVSAFSDSGTIENFGKQYGELMGQDQLREINTCLFIYLLFLLSAWFWGDPHIRTLDGGNYTFNGLGEYVMLDAQSGTFQLQARTGMASGNSTTGTVFVAGAAKEENTTTVEVRITKNGKG
mgnify:FL=1